MDEMIVSLWETLTSYIPAQYLGLAGTLVLVANLITMNTESTTDKAWLKPIKYVLNVLSLNIRKNRNADDKTDEVAS